MTGTRRAPVGMVAAADHLAAGAGVAMLRDGGTAADAAVAAGAVMAVTSPHLNGLGGDLFAIVHDGGGAGAGAPAALNSSGRAGSGADPDALRAEGLTEMPFRHDIRSATVPGCVDGWLALHDRFGRLARARVLEPAIAYATSGFPASPLLVAAVAFLGSPAGSEELTAGGGVATGDLVRRPGHARALAAIAAGGRAAWYEGEFGAELVGVGAGLFVPDDLARPIAEWVDPIGVRAWGHDLWTIPPNSQGYLTLLGAAIAAGLELPDDPADPLWAHLLIESARAAGYDRPEVLHEHADVGPLLAPDAVAARRSGIDFDRAAVRPVPAHPGGTTYLCAVDGDRMGVSLIQSNASGFGSHLFLPGLGVGLQNRGIGFSLEPGHPAEYGPGRRPPHTLSPALVTRSDGSLRAVLGTMGGDSQPQILLQLLARLLLAGESPGAAAGAPRWAIRAPGGTGFDTWTSPVTRIDIEADAPPAWADGLAARGHAVAPLPPRRSIGHAHVIEVTPSGLAGAADPRSLVGAAEGY
jgi:gamma-glutamyltranspeptidase/glutathione hydrolase